MKQTIRMEHNWELMQLPAPIPMIDVATVDSLMKRTENVLPIKSMPAQVHDVLLAHKLIPEETLVGWCQESEWVAKEDWIYRVQFHCDAVNKRVFLRFDGLDTVVHIYLNGQHIASHDDFFLPTKVEVTDVIKAENILLLHVRSPLAYSDEHGGPSYGEIFEEKQVYCFPIRKPFHDMPNQLDVGDGQSYQGAYPYHTNIGVYRDIYLEIVDQAAISEDWLRTKLNESYDKGELLVDLGGFGTLKSGKVKLTVRDDDNKFVTQTETSVCANVDTGWSSFLQVTIPNPELWYPRGFGKQARYTVEIQLWDGDFLCDELVKKVGFKDVKTSGNLDFVINGKIVRLWGGSMDPVNGFSHVYPEKNTLAMLDMVENANMNALRVWGESGIPQDERFYEECDKRGILIWQEFFMAHFIPGDSNADRTMYRQEAEALIRRLRHRACLLMWCGGNETIFTNEANTKYNCDYVGKVVLEMDYPEIIEKLDPGRYYLTSSPCTPKGFEGRFSNDYKTGDFHVFTCHYYHPESDYTNFVSEDIRVAPPPKHSLEKIIKGDLWPKDYTGTFRYEDPYPMPLNWIRRTSVGNIGHIKTGPIGEYYDADNLDDFMYKFGAAAAKDYRYNIEHLRMGSLDGGLYRADRSKGHFACKLNDTWPKIYCCPIDFFQEGFHSYYAFKRAQQPILVCFDIRKENINVWLVNDTNKDIQGRVVCTAFMPKLNRYLPDRKKSAEVTMPQGCSDIVFDLQDFMAIPRDAILYAWFEDESGKQITSSVEMLRMERHNRYPDAKLDVKVIGKVLEITTDKFAHCVEINGDADGRADGWRFEDNYFDLMPEQVKYVAILGEHKKGVITIKAHYAKKITVVNYDESEDA